MTEWNPNDPDASKVYYDLSGWNFDQQAELSAELAERYIPHAWEGAELVVPEDSEAETDEMFVALEARLGIVGAADEVVQIELAADATSTEYDLGEWSVLERDLVSDSLAGAQIPFRWEDEILLVGTENEEQVDDILDDVESGKIIPVLADSGEDDDELPFENLNSFFLAGERLKRNPQDASGLQRLLEALEVADPDRPPSGVELGVWRRSCRLAEDLADTLIAEDGDVDLAKPIAESLHDLLRPLI